MIDILDKWRLNRNILSDKISMPKSTFNNKVNPYHASQFNELEKAQLKKALQELKLDIETLINQL